MGVRLPPRAPTLRKRSPVRTAFGNALPTSNRAVHFPTLLQKKYNHEYQAVSATRRRTSEQNVNEDPARAHKRTPRRGAWFAHSKSPRRIRICETASNALLSPAQDHSPPQAVFASPLLPPRRIPTLPCGSTMGSLIQISRA